MTLIKRLERCIALLSMGLIFLNYQAAAYTLNLDFRDGRVRAINAIPMGNGYTLSDWEISSGLAPTSGWFPEFSGYAGDLTLTDAKGGTITLPISLIGLQFKYSDSFLGQANDLAQGSTCDVSIDNGSIIEVGSSSPTSSCSSNTILKTTDNSLWSPFSFTRPIFNFESIEAALSSGANLAGTYIGAISYPVRYFYINDQNILTYRVLNKSFGISLTYKPDYIESVTMPSLVKIEPIYDKLAKTISGSAKIPVVATGFFEYGLRMHLDERAYNLTNSDGLIIPYSLTCNTCNVTSLITQGVLQQVTFTHPVSGNKELINFDLDVSIDNASGANLETGSYSDNLTIYFEVDY
ncbi:hypothetical protein [Shewanella algae]|uniref:hypothetical protein n=1 Tax=Shewanella algae TaxID=38313 RepID=UPI0031F49EA8